MPPPVPVGRYSVVPESLTKNPLSGAADWLFASPSDRLTVASPTATGATNSPAPRSTIRHSRLSAGPSRT